MEIIFNNKKYNAYKANLHTHSKTSDGSYTHEQLIDLYGSKNYDVLAFTDHRKTNPVSTFDAKGMTLISGIELHPVGPRGINWHILALGVPEDFEHTLPETGQEAVDNVVAAGGIAFVAHPYWCGFTSSEVASLNGVYGIEVYNTSTRYIGKDYNMMCWDELLQSGYKYTALAVDDVHSYKDLFRAFTVIFAEDKSQKSLIEALKAGNFYASQGPLFEEISFEGRKLKAKFSPCTQVICCMKGSTGRCITAEDLGGPDTGVTEMTEFEIEFDPIYKDQYVRIQLKDAQGRMAWSNPFYIA